MFKYLRALSVEIHNCIDVKMRDVPSFTHIHTIQIIVETSIRVPHHTYNLTLNFFQIFTIILHKNILQVISINYYKASNLSENQTAGNKVQPLYRIQNFIS